ncbi:hypothetical protein L873DRAFT_275174 [Choiromyces venosus 120613-1]|uniref:Uncharacterized protein n=1 Tax=Choiromyces venosus 120613-1 TaxID=1336337 RepID=A0A3N4JXM6_9PEZI|nr:hypothetical protein L873DRAFT_275174 [Choiromyces venosus 120613-1]
MEEEIEYAPIASITAAFGSFENPMETTYPTYLDGRRGVSAAIGLSRDEKVASAFPDAAATYLTVFNSVVQIPGRDYGVVWFLKMMSGGRGDNGDRFCGVGVAEVRIDDKEGGGGGGIICERREEMIFNASGPRWGDISTVIHGDYIYLYGTGTPTSPHDGAYTSPLSHHPSSPTTLSSAPMNVPIHLCRVPYRNRSYWHAGNYKYWNGDSFLSFSSLSPSHSHQRAKPPEYTSVMQNFQSGTVFHSNMFSERGQFIFIGLERSPTALRSGARVKMSVADEPTGPWFGEITLLDLNTVDRGHPGMKFGVHVHTFASNPALGEILFSWSEPWPGGVEMARVKFAQSSPVVPPPTATLVKSTKHHRKNAHARVGVTIELEEDFSKEPIPEDIVLLTEAEKAEAEKKKLIRRDKAIAKAQAKISGHYRREDDSEADSESLFDFERDFSKIKTNYGLTPPEAHSNYRVLLNESRLRSPAVSAGGLPIQEGGESSSSGLPVFPNRYYSSYDLHTQIPEGLTGSWILNESDAGGFDTGTGREVDESNVLANHHNHNHSNHDAVYEATVQKLTNLQMELEAAVVGGSCDGSSGFNRNGSRSGRNDIANVSNNNNSSSINSSPQTPPHAKGQAFWLNNDNNSSSVNYSDTNTDYSNSPAAGVPSPPSPMFVLNQRHCYPSCSAGAHQVYSSPQLLGSPPSPPALLGIEGFVLASAQAMTDFEAQANAQRVNTATTGGGGRKHTVKKLLWGKKAQGEQEGGQMQMQMQDEADAEEKKGWKKSLKKSAVAKFLRGGGGGE